MDLSEFFENQARLLQYLPPRVRKNFMDRINWKIRLLGIVGARGTGKTTLLLQHLSRQKGAMERHLYISADHVKIHAMGLYEATSAFFRLGGESVYIDEVHKYPDWAREIKNLYDAFPGVRIRFSGSSTLALQAGKADLSRRGLFYDLPGFSFREYLEFMTDVEYRPLSLSELLSGHGEAAGKVLENGPVLGHFRRYLEYGVYPFFIEGEKEYPRRLMNVIEKVLYEDIPVATGIKAGSVPVLKRILWLIATSQPFSPNIARMSKDLGLSKEYVYSYLDALERAGLIRGVNRTGSGLRLVRKPARIFLDNTNIVYGIASQAGASELTGTLRETFFSHQLEAAGYSVKIPPRGDFLVDGHYLFEVGGRRKGAAQIRNEKNGFVVRDDVETGHGAIIPLWLFGFLY